MKTTSVCAVAVGMVLSAGFLSAATAAPVSSEEQLLSAAKQGPYAKIGPLLGNLYEEYSRSTSKKDFKTSNPTLRVQGGRLGLDLYATDAVALRQALASLGATRIGGRGALVSAQVPVSALSQLSALKSLSFARPALAMARVASQGSVVSQGDVSLGSNLVRQTTGLDGTGITVGVLSDSYRCNPPAFIAGAPTSTDVQDVATQDVPANVEVLDNGPCPGTDEGRAMVQLVHDVAPGAQQKFHSAYNSMLDFADGILELQDAGANVIVDDVIYFEENMFSDGVVAQAADRAVSRGAAYFTSAGNNARKSYESVYREVAVPTNGGANLNGKGAPFVLHAHDFDGGSSTDTLQKIHVTESGGQAVVVFALQWDQPFLTSTTYAHETDPTATSQPRGATGDLDLLIYDENGTLLPGCPPGLAVGITCQVTGDRNIGGDAVDQTVLVVTGPKSKSGDFYLRIVRSGGVAPQHVKYVPFEISGTVDIVEHDTKSGTAYGHSNAKNVGVVGASSWYLTGKFDSYFSKLVQDTPGACLTACLNDFSSAGGVPLYLDKYGVPLGSPELRQTPRFTGPDGGNTTFFYADTAFDDDDGDGCNTSRNTFITPCLDKPGDELPNFFGTSASAPHVAAVAALMLQKNSSLGAAQIYNILSNTAQDMTKREVAVVPGPGDSEFSPLPAGYDFDSGYGFVDAPAALAATPGGT